jgi:hypothetical protein
VVGVITAIVTYAVADQRAALDKELAVQRAAVDEKLAQFRGQVDEKIAQEKISAEQRQANRRPFLQKQLELCFEATDAAARVATETNSAEWEKSRLTFWRLYWGTLSIVEDTAVEGAMVKLGEIIPKTSVKTPVLPMVSVQGAAYELAHAARDLMGKSWDVNLPPLGGQR